MTNSHNNRPGSIIHIRLDDPIREMLEKMANANEIETDEFVSLMIEQAYTLYLQQFAVINQLKVRRMVLMREIEELNQQLGKN